jgi:fucose permease
MEKFGEKKMMVTAFILSLIGSLVFANVPVLAIFITSLFTIGAGMAILQVAINPLLRVAGGEEHFAFNSVLAQLIFGLASFISPQMYTWLVTGLEEGSGSTNLLIEKLRTLVPPDMTWVSVYWVFAMISLAMIVLILVSKFPSVELKEDEKVGTKDSYIDLFKNKYVILFFLGIFAYVGTEQGVSYWMSSFLEHYHGYDHVTVGAEAVAYFWGLMTIGGLLGLVLLKIVDSKIVLRWFTLASIISLIIALFGSKTMSLYAFPATGFFMSVMYPIIVSLALNSVKKHHGSFAGILMTGIMGGAVVQVLIGFISDITSLKTGMTFLFITMGYIFSIGIWARPLISNKTIDLFKKKKETV